MSSDSEYFPSRPKEKGKGPPVLESRSEPDKPGQSSTMPVPPSTSGTRTTPLPLRFGMELECIGSGVEDRYYVAELLKPLEEMFYCEVTAENLWIEEGASRTFNVAAENLDCGESEIPTTALELQFPALILPEIETFVLETLRLLEDSHYDFRLNVSCGFHVHVSPVERKWSLQELQLIASAIFLTEEMANKIHPLHRYDCENVNIRPLKLCHWIKTAFQEADGTRNYKKLIMYIFERCIAKLDISDIFHATSSGGQDKHFTYSFLSTLPNDGKGTIEFRQHDATLDASVIIGWVHDIDCFIQRSLQATEADYKRWADGSGMPKDILYEFWPALKDIDSTASFVPGNLENTQRL